MEQSPRFGVVGREVTAKFKIEDPAGGAAPVTLSVNGEVVRRIDVPVGKSVELPITVGNPGANVVELEVAPGQNELTLDNNRGLFTINGVRDRLRVLLVSGEPYPGERAWRKLLKSDPAVDLVHFTILRPPEKDDFTPMRELALIAFPMRELFEQKLKEFDLIIFDRYESARPAHARLSPQHRRLCARRRRAAGIGRAGVRRRQPGLPHAARRGAAGRADRAT